MSKWGKFLLSNRYVYYIVSDLLFGFCSWGAVRLFAPEEASLLGLFTFLWTGFPVSFVLYEMAQKRLKK